MRSHCGPSDELNLDPGGCRQDDSGHVADSLGRLAGRQYAPHIDSAPAELIFNGNEGTEATVQMADKRPGGEIQTSGKGMQTSGKGVQTSGKGASEDTEGH